VNGVTETSFELAAVGPLLELWRQVMPRDAPDPDRFRDIALLDRAFRPEGLVLLWRGSRLIGFGYAVAAGTRGWLASLGVAEDERGQGHGSRILRSCLGFLASAGCTSVELGGHGERYLLPGADPVAYPAFGRLLLAGGFRPAGETSAMARPLDRENALAAVGLEAAGLEAADLEEAGLEAAGLKKSSDGGYAAGGYVYRHPDQGELPELLRVACAFGPGWRGLIRSHLSRTGDTGNLWVAYSADGSACGFAGFELFPGCPGRFGPMGVLPAARGAGVGGRLVRLSLSSMAKRGVRSAWFLWGPESESGRRMYASAGFGVNRRFEFFRRDLPQTACERGNPR
jgi:ribosomal protein S18 acetylase RimI-like enzyme